MMEMVAKGKTSDGTSSGDFPGRAEPIEFKSKINSQKNYLSPLKKELGSNGGKFHCKLCFTRA